MPGMNPEQSRSRDEDRQRGPGRGGLRDLNPDQPLILSVLDRLIDTDPELLSEPPRSRNQTLRELKQAVRRDLQNLLNTRVRCIPSPPEWKELAMSMVNYGIPDLTGSTLGSDKERKAFRREIQDVIARFEPRLKSLSVSIVDTPESVERAIRFRIDAVLLAEPAPEPIQLDSTLTLTTGTFEVKGARDE